MTIEIASEHALRARTQISMLASAQHGVVSRAQLLERGIGRGAIAHGMRCGWLIPVRPGVYAVGHTALAPRAHRMAALLDVGPGSALSFVAAGALHGVRASAARLIDITVADRRRGRAGVRLHHAPLPPEQVTVIDGLAVTTIERTLLDLAAVLPRGALVHALEEAELRRLPDWRVLDELIAGARGRRGIRALREIRAHHAFGSQITKSGLERAFQAFLRRHPDLPAPARTPGSRASRSTASGPPAA